MQGEMFSDCAGSKVFEKLGSDGTSTNTEIKKISTLKLNSVYSLNPCFKLPFPMEYGTGCCYNITFLVAINTGRMSPTVKHLENFSNSAYLLENVIQTFSNM